MILRTRTAWAGLVAVAAMAALPSAGEASSRLSRNEPIGSLSASLLLKDFDKLTGTQQNQVICDPVEPQQGSTSLFYDRGHAAETGATRVTLAGLLPGPGYRVRGLVLVQTPATPAGGGGQLVFQPLDTFLGDPQGAEVGYAQVFFEKVGATGRMEPLAGLVPFDEENVLGDGEGVDTHAFVFDYKDASFNDDVIEYRHFAADGGLGNARDLMTFADAQGEFVVTRFDDAVVHTPEPGSLAALAVGAIALVRRRRRRRA